MLFVYCTAGGVAHHEADGLVGIGLRESGGCEQQRGRHCDKPRTMARCPGSRAGKVHGGSSAGGSQAAAGWDDGTAITGQGAAARAMVHDVAVLAADYNSEFATLRPASFAAARCTWFLFHIFKTPAGRPS